MCLTLYKHLTTKMYIDTRVNMKVQKSPTQGKEIKMQRPGWNVTNLHPQTLNNFSSSTKYFTSESYPLKIDRVGKHSSSAKKMMDAQPDPQTQLLQRRGTKVAMLVMYKEVYKYVK